MSTGTSREHPIMGFPYEHPHSAHNAPTLHKCKQEQFIIVTQLKSPTKRYNYLDYKYTRSALEVHSFRNDCKGHYKRMRKQSPSPCNSTSEPDGADAHLKFRSLTHRNATKYIEIHRRSFKYIDTSKYTPNTSKENDIAFRLADPSDWKLNPKFWAITYWPTNRIDRSMRIADGIHRRDS